MKCGYIRQIWECGLSREVEEKHTGRYGARGQKRADKRKATPEDIRRQNHWKKVRDLRRLLKWNFSEGDSWITLTYKKENRPGWEQMMKDMRDFIKKLRARYQKHGWILKYIWRPQIGKKGAAHIHILLNAQSNAETRTEKIVRDLWTHGNPDMKVVYDLDDGKLAEYIATPLQEWEPEAAKNYHPSRNLVRKEPEQETILRRSLVDKRGIIKEPKAPKGYYVDPNSIEKGINPVTGYVYRRYTLIKLDRRI